LNKKNFELFWYWINERHSIFMKRLDGELKPWTEDPIFQVYKFTNVFRELDRGTVWLRENYIEKYPHDELMLFNIMLYRQLNTIGTIKEIGYLDNWDPDKVASILEARQGRGERVFSNAYLVVGCLGGTKIEQIVYKVMTVVWENLEPLYRCLSKTRTVKAACDTIFKYKGFGRFISYEVACDLYHTEILRPVDRMTWANPGPGAMKGLKLLFPDMKGGFNGAIKRMRLLLSVSKSFLAYYVPELEMRDIEHSLCEFQKYHRTANGIGRPKLRWDGLHNHLFDGSEWTLT